YAFAAFAAEMSWTLFILPFVVLLFRREREVWLLLLVFLGQAAYSIYVGGDAWEHKGGANRYVAIAMPYFFLLFVYALELVREALAQKAGLDNRWGFALTRLGLVLFTLGSLFNFNFFQNYRSLEQWALIRQPSFIQGNRENTRIG